MINCPTCNKKLTKVHDGLECYHSFGNNNHFKVVKSTIGTIKFLYFRKDNILAQFAYFNKDGYMLQIVTNNKVIYHDKLKINFSINFFDDAIKVIEEVVLFT